MRQNKSKPDKSQPDRMQSENVGHDQGKADPLGPIGQNIDAVVSLHLSNERNVNGHQRFIETITNNIGRPSVLYVSVAIAVVWMLVNGLGKQLGISRWDPPPFSLLQTLMAFAALVVAIAVLITQNRQAHVDRLHAQLDLQISLAIDQRAAKIIGLIEELRRDSPMLPNRVDREAENLTSAVDPQEVVTELENRYEAAVQEAHESDHAHKGHDLTHKGGSSPLTET